MSDALRNGKKVIFFGNGGSAADAQHLAAELLGRFYLSDRVALPGIALTTNTSVLTAIGNDYGYDLVFSRQLRGLGSRGDVAVGISTSGNSPNVVAALETAAEMGLVTIGLTGRSGGKVKSIAKYCFCMPTEDTPRIQEAHIFTGHLLCELVEVELFEPACSLS
jgi:D-sedoheptulose 7-phosphate isomerase